MYYFMASSYIREKWMKAFKNEKNMFHLNLSFNKERHLGLSLQCECSELSVFHTAHSGWSLCSVNSLSEGFSTLVTVVWLVSLQCEFSE